MNAKAHDPDLVGDIRAIKAEIARLQGKLAAATEELLGKGHGSAPVAGRVAAPSIGRREPPNLRAGAKKKLAEGSAAEWAARAIRQAGRPLNGHELVKAIEEQGHKVKLNTLIGSLYRWVKKKSVFYLAAPNTFGLLEMKKA